MSDDGAVNLLNHRVDASFAAARATLAGGEPVVLLTVVRAQGSTPGRPGFKMVVPAQGVTVGTIGGGIMELRLLDVARTMLAEKSRAPRLLKQTHHKKAPLAEQSGMICAGSQWQILWPLWPDQVALLDEIIDHYRRQVPALLCVASGETPCLQAAEDQTPAFAFTQNGDDFCWRERIGVVDTVYVIGSGHVGLALCRVLQTLGDVRVVAVDHRADVATLLNNTHADEKQVLPMAQVGALVPAGDHVFAVIVTTGFDSDAEALFQLIEKPTAYLGLMGSKAKIAEIKKQVTARGVDPALFDRVAMPIGLAIGAETPAEIAVSICAQIIACRKKRLQPVD